MLKHTIMERFSQAAEKYETIAHVQYQCAQFLVQYIQETFPNFVPKTILDIGTGTGYIIDRLHPTFPHAQYTLNDISCSMLKFCQKKFHTHLNFEYILGDCEHLNVLEQDLIISNLALQWVLDLPSLLQKLVSNAAIVAFSCLLEPTFSKWYEHLKTCGVIDQLPHYPTLSEMQTVCKTLTPSVISTSVSFHLRFDTAHKFMRYLQTLGATTLAQASSDPLPRCIFESSPVEVEYHVFFAILS